MRTPKIVVLEFNELCPELLHRWMAQDKLPNFRRFHEQSSVFTVQADTEDNEWLEPWIQWFSAHTGVPCSQHQVHHLTDGPRKGSEITDIWHALLGAGYRVGNCGSMNAPRFAAPHSFYIPDPWCTSEAPYPEEIAAYHRLVMKKVQENSNSSEGLSKKDYLDFLRFIGLHGLSTHSVSAVFGQLIAERRENQVSWKRAALLDKLQRDVFFHYWKKLQPHFSTFFLNSTAHFQHSYFHLAAPERFGPDLQASGDEPHRSAVFYGFQEMDKLIGDFFTLEARGAVLVFMTALSQRPWERAGMAYYRPKDIGQLLDTVDVHPKRVSPVMAQQYSAEFASAEEAASARTRMDQIRLGASPLFDYGASEPGTLFFGVAVRADVAGEALVTFPSNQHPAIRFHDLCYRMPETKVTVHHPRSMLWVKTGNGQVHDGAVSLLDIYPTFLDYFGVPVPQDPGYTRPGSSFFPRLGLAHFPRQEKLMAA